MEHAGTWTRTTILVSGDYPYREPSALNGKTDGRVPFLLRPADQKEGKTYNRSFNAPLTRDLLMEHTARRPSNLRRNHSVVG